MSRFWLVVLAFSLPARLLMASTPLGCASIGPRNEPVGIATESAIILWDEVSKTQHFIRRASFQTKADNFGFLVPTPSQPKLEEADDKAFDALYEVTKPKIENRKRPPVGCACGSKGKGDATMTGKVDVLEEKDVAGFKAAVLKATDPEALQRWLEANDYPFPKSLLQWSEPYIKEKWTITAFKIAKKEPGKEESTRVGLKALRMTFTADTPVFPYREPKDEAEKGTGDRLLRVYFLAKSRMAGKLKDEVWPGTTVWAGKISDEQRKDVLKLVGLPEGAPPAEWWLTELEDRSARRPGDSDLFFSVSDDQNSVERRPHIRFVARAWGGCVMSCALAVAMIGLVVTRRRGVKK